jgi:trans-2,3-dihydro-3-hydroxyanthranilate isomerase
MAAVRYRIVDVFTDRPLSGNALCVVLDPCPGELMQPIAREMNLSETTFITARSERAYSMRIFTPGVELPFAGHPTLGSAWLMGPGEWTQTTAGASVLVSVDAEGAEMTQPAPAVVQVDGAGVREASGVDQVLRVWRAEAGGTAHLIAAVDSPLEALRPRSDLVQNLLDRHHTTTFGLVERIDSQTLRVRVLFRSAGIAEDPGTGSFAGPCGLLARSLWGLDTDILIHQGDEIGRPCRIRVHADPDDLRVGGDVVLAAEGEFAIPSSGHIGR